MVWFCLQKKVHPIVVYCSGVSFYHGEFNAVDVFLFESRTKLALHTVTIDEFIMEEIVSSFGFSTVEKCPVSRKIDWYWQRKMVEMCERLKIEKSKEKCLLKLILYKNGTWICMHNGQMNTYVDIKPSKKWTKKEHYISTHDNLHNQWSFLN